MSEIQIEGTQGEGYGYTSEEHCHMHDLLIPKVESLLEQLEIRERLFDLGCGNGSTAAHFSQMGYSVVGVDPSEQGIQFAKKHVTNAQLELGSCYDDLAGEYGQFPCVLSLEVVEHVFFPKVFAKNLYDLVEDDGYAFVSTPYHGYLKNLALAISGKMDSHFTALWDYGHIKFWSEKTLQELLLAAGFKEVIFHRLGRISPLAKTMLAVAKK